MRHVVVGIIATIFTIAVIFFAYRFVIKESSDYADEINFNQIGNLVRNNPGFEPDTWYFVYDMPGAPGSLKKLAFDSASACAINAPAAPCDLSKLEQGSRVRVEGRESPDAVLVRTIQSPEVIPPEDGIAATGTNPTPSATGTKATGTTATGTNATGTNSTSTPRETGLTVKLYYYNQMLDQGPGGAQCSSKGLVAVERVIPRTNTPLQDTIKLLLRGELSDEEREKGITSEFPLSRVTLLSASNDNGVLTLTFRDPRNRTSGGACRVSIMKSEIEATAKQFSGVNNVRFMPETLFQP